MADTTTIEITKAQAEQLQQKKTHSDESYKSVIGRMLNGDNSAITDVDTAALAEQLQDHIDYPESQDTDKIIRRIEDLETQLPAKVAEELQR